MRLRGLLIMLWMVAFSLQAVAQTDYRPMLKEGKSWDWYFANTPSREAAINLTIVGDTVIDGEQCYKTSFQMTNLASGTVVQTANYATYLEKDKKVYIRTNDSWILVYDFDRKKGDVTTTGDNFREEVLDVDEINVKGETYRRLTLLDTYIDGNDTLSATVYLVEGIGCSKGLMTPGLTSSFGGTWMKSCSEDGNLIFSGWDFGALPLYYEFLTHDGLEWKMEYKLSVSPDRGDIYSYSDLKMMDMQKVDGIYFYRVYAQGHRSNGKDYYSWRPQNYWVGEKDGRVYQLRDGTTDYHPIMDFTLKVGEELEVSHEEATLTYKVVAVSDTILDCSEDHRLRHCIYVQGVDYPIQDCWIEGIGSLTYGINGEFVFASGSSPRLLQCHKNGKQLYWCGDEIVTVTVDHPVDMTSLIVNPRFDNNDVTTGWSGTRLYCYDTHENAEVYSNTFDVFQKVEGLPKGVYAVGVKAFYIAGGDLAKSYKYFKTNDEASHFAKLYVDVEGQQRETSICSVYENDRTEPLGCDGEKTLTDDEMGKTYYFPYYSLAAAERYMHELNCYDNKVLAMTGGTLTLGVRKSKKIGGDWSVFDDFSLTYYGNGADAYQMYLDDVQQANENETIDEGTLYTEMYLNDVRRHRTATSETEVSEALADIQSAYAALQRNIDLWKDWKQMMDRGNGIAGAPCFAGSEQAQQLTQRCTVEAAETEAARSLTNEQLEAEISETEQLINALYDLDCAPGKMLVEGKQWVYTHYRDSLVYDGNGIPYDVVRVVTKVVYTISGDTLIDGRSYVKLYRQEESEAPVYWMGLCEEGGTIYWCNREKNQAERFIEYNPIYLNEYITDIYMPDMRDEIDYVTVNDRLFIRHNYSFGYTGMIVTAVEGVGYEQCGILGMFFGFTPSNYVRFEACYEDGECIFTAADFYKPGINTGIESMYNEQDAKNNGMQEGTRNNVLYDLQGRRIQGSPKHGVYIQNGKKVMK